MKQFIRDYLTFNKRERNGLFVLIVIIILLIAYLCFSDKFIKPEIVDFSKFENEIEVFNKSIENSKDSLKSEKKYSFQNEASNEFESNNNSKSKPAEYFNFNPNNLPDKDWERLGLSEKQIHTIKNYESKGGKFHSKEDVKKMYCIPEKQYLSLEPFIQIKDSEAHNNFESKPAEHFNFNPNNLPDKDWERLGMSEKQIHTIKNYESKGGKFHSKEDVKKMYCIPEKQYLSLEPYIQIPSDKNSPADSKAENFKSESIIVDINSADTLQLMKVKGIGAFYAKSIIKYRNLLGGFAAKEQLMEMWKFDSIKFDKIKKNIIVDPTEIKKIHINTCTAAELKHPYLKWNAANAIVNYRSKHGKYKTLQEIKKTDLVDDETYRKIVPYLTLE